eukprot:6089029-Pleurochrysis_carterae.AAC.1
MPSAIISRHNFPSTFFPPFSGLAWTARLPREPDALGGLRLSIAQHRAQLTNLRRDGLRRASGTGESVGH